MMIYIFAVFVILRNPLCCMPLLQTQWTRVWKGFVMSAVSSEKTELNHVLGRPISTLTSLEELLMVWFRLMITKCFLINSQIKGEVDLLDNSNVLLKPKCLNKRRERTSSRMMMQLFLTVRLVLCWKRRSLAWRLRSWHSSVFFFSEGETINTPVRGAEGMTDSILF